MVVTEVVIAPVTPPIRTTPDLGLEMTASMATKDVQVVVVAPIGVAAAGAADGSILSSKKVANFSKTTNIVDQIFEFSILNWF